MKKYNLITELPKNYEAEFLVEYNNTLYANKINPINVVKAKLIIDWTKKYYQNTKTVTPPDYVQYLLDTWYYSEHIAYEVYDQDYYITDIWCCYQIYSRKYLLSIIKSNSLQEDYSIFNYLNNVNTVVDLGNGVGYSTALLKQIFSEAEVIGTNIKSTKQYKYCEKMADVYDFKMIENEKTIGKQVDFLFASEYFEHILDPITDVLEIINTIKPRYMFIANSFNTYSVGHFETYDVKGIGKVDQTKISRLFNKTLRDNGYKKIKTKLWNNKPALWELM